MLTLSRCKGAFIALLVGFQNTVRNRLLKGRKIALLHKFELDTYRLLKKIINSTISNQVSIQKVR
jgi:hypothetical protein